MIVGITKGQVGAKIDVDIQKWDPVISDFVADNLTGATAISMKLVSPTGVVTTKTTGVTLPGSPTNRMRFTTQSSSDLNESGYWHVACFYTLSSVAYETQTSQFLVVPNT